MKVTAIKTHKITIKDKDLFKILDSYLPILKEKTIVVITSKILAICQGRVIAFKDGDREDLAKKEADFYIPKEKNEWGFTLTIKDGIMIASSGIDKSNGNGFYVLWPKNSQDVANEIKNYLCKKFALNNLGVIITDSRISPLRRGLTGIAISYCGFNPLNDYRGKTDLFGQKMLVSRANIADALACAAVAVMGEGKEQTPICLIEDIPFVKFRKRNPTKKELLDLKVSIKEDVFSSMLKSGNWEKGDGKNI